MSIEELDILKEFYGTANITDTITCAVYDAIKDNTRTDKLSANEKITYLIGQKNGEMCEFLNEAFTSATANTEVTEYIEPFAGTANVYLHTSHSEKDTILNELDKLRRNLLIVIRNYPLELKVQILGHQPSLQYFNYCKNALHNVDLSTKKSRIKAAAMYYFIFNCSAYGKGKSFTNVKPHNYFRRADALSVIHKKLYGTVITNYDALYLSRKKKNLSNALIYFDPPYLFSEDYYGTGNKQGKVFTAHTKLCNRVEELAKNNICFVSYRITLSKTLKKNGRTEAELKKILDKLYLNRGFHISFKTLKNTNSQTEILINSIPFEDSIPYVLTL